MTPRASPHVPVSWGELLDKLTILEIKQQRIHDRAAQANVARELAGLDALAADVRGDPRVANIVADLKAVNESLWQIEDAIRREEALGHFGTEFIGLARAVYQQNDRRAALKRDLNTLLGSDLVEEKSYWTAPAHAPLSGPEAKA